MIISFLKRGRERKRTQKVSRRYWVPARTFLGVPDHSGLQPFTVLDRFYETS
jgi:hypothetical protein